MAVAHLKRQANKKSEGSLAYVKGGLSTFFEAQDALSGKVTLRAICWASCAETRPCVWRAGFTGCAGGLPDVEPRGGLRAASAAGQAGICICPCGFADPWLAGEIDHFASLLWPVSRPEKK